VTTEAHVHAKYVRFQRAQTVLILFTIICLLASLGLLVYNSTTAKAARSDQSSALRLLVECTTAPSLRNPPEKNVPDSDCYTRQQQASASFTAPDGPFASLIAAAAACGSAHPNNIPRTRECIVDALS
jgi:hypothetical protein